MTGWRLLSVILALLPIACTVPGQGGGADFGQLPVTAPPTPMSAAAAEPGAQLAMAPGRVAVPAGFRAVPQAVDIAGPSALAADDLGGVLLIEGGNRLVRLGPAGGRDVIAEGAAGTRWTGIAAQSGVYYVTASGAREGGRLLRIGNDGRAAVLLDGLPDGPRPVSSPAIGPDGMVYIGIGAVSNAGIVEADNPARVANPAAHDIPCQDVRLRGINAGQGAERTGAFVPFGTATKAGQVIPGQGLCTGAVLRASPQGGPPQLVAWGLRDPHSLTFSPEGRLYLADGNYQAATLRPVGEGGDLLFAVAAGVWYGWPDSHGSQPSPAPLLAAQPNPPPRPLAEFPAGSRVGALDIARADLFGGPRQLYVGLAVPRFGARIARLDLATGALADFAEFPEGAAPVALRFSPTGESLYVLDAAGTLWRIERDVPVG